MRADGQRLRGPVAICVVKLHDATLDEIRNLKCGQWVWIEVANSETFPGGAFYHCELADDAETIEDPYTYTSTQSHTLSVPFVPFVPFCSKLGTLVPFLLVY